MLLYSLVLLHSCSSTAAAAHGASNDLNYLNKLPPPPSLLLLLLVLMLHRLFSANGAPIIANRAVVTTNQGLPLLIDLLAGASDPEKDTISVSITSGPALGSLVQQASGKWLYTPFNDGTGSDWFEYYVADDRGARSAIVAADVTIE